MPIVLNTETYETLMGDEVQAHVRVFGQRPTITLSLEELHEYERAMRVLGPLFLNMRAQLDYCEALTRQDAYVLIDTTLPSSEKDLLACRCNYFFHKTEKQLYYFRPTINEKSKLPRWVKEKVTISDCKRLETGLRAAQDEGGSDAFVEYFGKIKHKIVYLTEEQVHHLIVDNGGHQQMHIHPFFGADLTLLELETNKITHLCVDIQAHEVIPEAELIVEGDEYRTRINQLYNALVGDINLHAHIIGSCGRVVVNIRVAHLCMGVVSDEARQKHLELWQIVLISLAAIGVSVATGGALAPLIIPVVAGALGSGIAAAAVATALVGLTAGAAGSLVGSIGTSLAVGDSLDEAVNRAFLAVLKGAAYGAIGGAFGGALSAAAAPLMVTPFGEQGAKTIIGGTTGLVTGAVRGAVTAVSEKQSLGKAVKTIATQATIGLSVGAAAGLADGLFGTAGAKPTTEQAPPPAPPKLLMSHPAPAPMHDAGVAVVMDSGAGVSAASAGSTVSDSKRKTAKEETKVDTIVLLPKLSPEELKQRECHLEQLMERCEAARKATDVKKGTLVVSKKGLAELLASFPETPRSRDAVVFLGTADTNTYPGMVRPRLSQPPRADVKSECTLM